MLIDTIVSGDILTLDRLRPEAKRMGVWQGRIVGFDEELEGLEARHQYCYDSGCVLPGFVDAHTHLSTAGMISSELDLSREEDISGVLSRVSSATDGSEAWVEAWGYDQRKLGRHISLAELDEVSTVQPIVLRHVSSHAMVLNSAAIARIPNADLRANVQEADGLVFEKSQEAVRGIIEPISLARIETAVESATRQALSEGVTTCIDAGVGGGLCSYSESDLSAYVNLAGQGRLGTRVQLMPSIDLLHHLRSHVSDGTCAALDLGMRQGFGDDKVWLGPVKIWFDGGFSTRSAAVTESYIGSEHTGMLAEDEDSLRNKLIAAHKSGWDVAAHAIGDRALDAVISAFQEAQQISPQPARRHRVEHGTLIRDDQLADLAALNLTIVSQPNFLRRSGGDLRAILGDARLSNIYRGRALLDAGVQLVGSTDRPLAGTPLEGIQALVDRTTWDGTRVGQDESIQLRRALEAYTLGGAWLARKENSLGRLSKGMLADFVVLEKSLFDTAIEKLSELRVVATFVDGCKRY